MSIGMPPSPPYQEEYEIQVILDMDNDDIIHILINNRYIGKLNLVSNSRSNRFFNRVCNITINHKLYSVNREKFVVHLNSLGFTNIQDLHLNYNKLIATINKEILLNYTDRMCNHISEKNSLILTKNYHYALTRNDYQEAINIIKRGASLKIYHVVNKMGQQQIYSKSPTIEEISNFFCSVVPWSFLVDARSDTIVCTAHSPLTAVLSRSDNDVQEKYRNELIQLLKELGTSTIKLITTYKMFCNSTYDYPRRLRVTYKGMTTIKVDMAKTKNNTD